MEKPPYGEVNQCLERRSVGIVGAKEGALPSLVSLERDELKQFSPNNNADFKKS